MPKPTKNERTRAAILAGAARSFRSRGYEGAGVDGLAKEAGLTSGAFYTHFKSKADAFRETVQVGMRDLEKGIREVRAQAGDRWLETFADFYLGERRTCPLTESCALQSLTAEVARADEQTREAFEAELRAVIAAAAEGIADASVKARRERAIVMLVLLSGGVSLARAVSDPAFSSEIARAIRSTVIDGEAPKASAGKRAGKKAGKKKSPPRRQAL